MNKKYYPRAKLSTIGDIIFPVKKYMDPRWKRKNLQDIEKIKDKLIRLEEEKIKEIENQPEPYKLPQFQKIPSKLKSSTDDWVNNQLRKNSHRSQIMISNNRRNYFNNNERKNNSLPVINVNNRYNYKSENKNSMFYNYYSNLIKQKKLKNTALDKSNNNNKLSNNISQISEIEVANTSQNNNKIDPAISLPNDQEIQEKYLAKLNDRIRLESLLNQYEGNEDINNISNNNEEIIQNNNMNNNINNKYLMDPPIILPKINRNYIKENRMLVIDNKIPQKKFISEEEKNAYIKHKDYGKVPNYIKKYEMEREIYEKELKKKKEEKNYPKGTRLLPENERVECLKNLIKSKHEIMSYMEKLPITARSVALVNRKEELYKKLEEIEKNIDKFSRKKVFIKK